jgi:hypothetical protein
MVTDTWVWWWLIRQFHGVISATQSVWSRVRCEFRYEQYREGMATTQVEQIARKDNIRVFYVHAHDADGEGWKF